MSNPKILVCNNDNLRDRKYRVDDGIHLTEIGTSRFANNLKHKIAESLGISVVRKSRTFNNRPEYHGNFSRDSNGRNRSNYDRYDRYRDRYDSRNRDYDLYP